MLNCKVNGTFLVFSQLIRINPELHEFVEKFIGIWVLTVINKQVVE